MRQIATTINGRPAIANDVTEVFVNINQGASEATLEVRDDIIDDEQHAPPRTCARPNNNTSDWLD